MRQLRSLLLCGLAAAFLIPFTAFSATRDLKMAARVNVGDSDPLTLIVTGDFTGDGKKDVLVSNPHFETRRIRVSPGLGNGSFGAAIVTDPGAWVAQGTADLNGDQRLDVYVLDFLGKAGIMFGAGDGTFAPAVPVPASIVPHGLVAGDFTGDGRIDLAIYSEDDTHIVIAAGNGSGEFSSQTSYPMTRFGVPHVNVTGDFDDDGRLDLAIAGREVNILWNNGSSFSRQTLNTEADDAAVGDVNGDGIDDLTLSDFYGTWVCFGKTTRGLTASKISSAVAGSVTVAHLDGDSRADIVSGAELLTVWTHDGTAFRKPHTFGIGETSRGMATADFDGDGAVDVAGLPRSPQDQGYFWSVRGKNDGSLHGNAAIDLDNAIGRIGGVTSAFVSDANGDGELDLVAVTYLEREVAVLFGHGDGTFAAPVLTALPNSRNAAVHDASDLNGDGRGDLVLWDPASVPGQMRFYSLLSQTDGTFTIGPPQTSQKIIGNNTYLERIADYTGDGIPDLLEKVGFLHPGLGNGSFGAPIPLGFDYLGADVAVADVNGDAKLDLVVRSGADVFVHMNAGGGAFAAPVRSFRDGTSIAAADVNGDGLADVAGSARFSLGRGDGTFEDTLWLEGTDNVTGNIVAGDFDGDGKVDLATSAVVYYGTGTGFFDAAIQFGSNSSIVSVADMDHDGTNDLWMHRGGRVTIVRGAEEQPKLASQVDLSAGENPIPVNELRELIAHVSAPPAATRPRGAVLLRTASEEPYMLKLVRPDGIVQDWVFGHPAGASVTYTATYTGDPFLQPSTSALTIRMAGGGRRRAIRH